MKKEILTTEKIISEEKIKFKNITKSTTISFVVLALLIIFVLWIFIVVLEKVFLLIVVLLGIVPCALMMAILLWIFFEEYSEYRNLKNGYFRVTTDTLINYEDNQPDLFSVSAGFTPRLYTLWFKTYGKYTLDTTMHYHTSKNFTMSGDGIFNTAITGDTFILILNEKEKILQIYNTKFFEYKIEK